MKRYFTFLNPVLILTGLVLLLAVLPAALIGPAPPEWAPPPLRNWAFDLRLAAGTPAKSLLSAAEGTIWDKTLYSDNFGRPVAFQSQGLTLAATLYQPAAAGRHPAVLLLHGSTPVGRKLGLYRILGKELARRGYVVLSIDQRGYGESDDPGRVDSVAAFDFAGDVKSAVDYLAALESVDPKRLYIVGHSFGGDVAITAGIQEDRLQKIVAIGPARRFQERGGAPGAPELAYFRRRDMRYMKLSEAIPGEIFLQARVPLLIENHLDYFSRPDHKPLLLIDGALESAEDRRFLEQIYDSMAEPKAYITLAQADHYANVANIGPLVIADEPAITQLVQEIDLWLSDGLGQRAE